MKQYIGLLLLAFFVLGGLTACMGEEKKAEDPAIETKAEQGLNEEAQGLVTVDGDEAKKLVEEGAVLVDVRTEEEYDAGHIEGSILIPYDQMNELAAQKLPDKEQKIVVYCRSGRRSQIAAEELLHLGYAHIYDMGSIQSWDK